MSYDDVMCVWQMLKVWWANLRPMLYRVVSNKGLIMRCEANLHLNLGNILQVQGANLPFCYAEVITICYFFHMKQS